MTEQLPSIDNLPMLTDQQNEFVRLYVLCGHNATEAYRLAYESTGKTSTCSVEGSKLLKNPKITLWIEHYKQTRKDIIDKEIEYTALEAFREFDELKIIALEETGKDGKPNIAAANKAVEMKCKLKGLLKEDATINNSVTVTMPDIEVNGEALEFKIGDDPNDGATK